MTQIINKFSFKIFLLLLVFNPAFSNGYKDIKFDMNIEEVLDLAKSNNASYFQEENMSSQIITIEGLYKYNLKVWFYEESEIEQVDTIQVIIFDANYRDRFFVKNNSGIEGFENIRNILNKKYKLLSEPDDLSIDRFNHDGNGDQIIFTYLSDEKPKFIIELSLKTYNHEKYIATGWYTNPKHTDWIINELSKHSHSYSSDDF